MKYTLLKGSTTFKIKSKSVTKWNKENMSLEFENLDDVKKYLDRHNFTEDIDGIYYKEIYNEIGNSPVHVRNTLIKIIELN